MGLIKWILNLFSRSRSCLICNEKIVPNEEMYSIIQYKHLYGEDFAYVCVGCSGYVDDYSFDANEESLEEDV